MNRSGTTAFTGKRAFSLIEVLVVISVIGILASIALPNISNITNRANFARSERNAQNVASLLSAARSAGATNQWTTVEEAVDDLEDTIIVRVGTQDVSFGVPEFSSEERTEMMEHLTLDPAKAMVYYAGSSGN